MIKCYQVVKACIHPSIPEDKRNQAFEYDGLSKVYEAKLKLIKDKKSKQASKLVTIINKYKTSVKRLIVPSRRQVCQLDVEKQIKDTENSIGLNKVQQAMTKDEKKKEAIAAEIKRSTEKIERLKGRRFVCAIVRTKINGPNCEFWNRHLDTVERHIEQAEKKLDRVHHRENSIEKKNAISDLEVFIKIQKSKTVSLKKNIKNCEQLEEKKKVCKSCFNRCKANKSECMKKHCGSKQRPEICAYRCTRRTRNCNIHCAKKNKCKRSSFELRCTDECKDSSNCLEKCNGSKMGLFLCNAQCTKQCKVKCRKNAKKYLKKTNHFLQCRRQDMKRKYIEFLLSRIAEKKKDTKPNTDKLDKVEKTLLKKKDLVAKVIKKFECSRFKSSPFCSKVRVGLKCSKVDPFVVSMANFKNKIAQLEKQKALLCSKHKHKKHSSSSTSTKKVTKKRHGPGKNKQVPIQKIVAEKIVIPTVVAPKKAAPKKVSPKRIPVPKKNAPKKKSLPKQPRKPTQKVTKLKSTPVDCTKLAAAKKEIQELYKQRKSLLNKKRGTGAESQKLKEKIVQKLRETRVKYRGCFKK